MVNIGIIGLGHWGPNLVRNFSDHPEVRVRGVCDIDDSTFKRVERFLDPNCVKTKNPYELIKIYGPVTAAIYKIKYDFRVRLLIKYNPKVTPQSEIKKSILRKPTPSNLKLQVDVDPLNFT